jgi:hypothetical protein
LEFTIHYSLFQKKKRLALVASRGQPRAPTNKSVLQ